MDLVLLSESLDCKRNTYLGDNLKDLTNTFPKIFLLFWAELCLRPSSMLSDLFVHQKLLLRAFMQGLLLLVNLLVNQGVPWVLKVPGFYTSDVL